MYKKVVFTTACVNITAITGLIRMTPAIIQTLLFKITPPTGRIELLLQYYQIN